MSWMAGSRDNPVVLKVGSWWHAVRCVPDVHWRNKNAHINSDATANPHAKQAHSIMISNQPIAESHTSLLAMALKAARAVASS